VSTVLTELDGTVLVVTLNRPERLNALTPEMLAELTRTWARAAEPDVRAVVVTGAGRGFCAGADLQGWSTGNDPATSGLRHTFNPQALALAGLEKPVVAAVNGPVAGAGLALALAADVRFGSPATSFVPAFSRIGIVPDSGVTYFAPRLLGYARAFDWLVSGDRLDAATAREWGLLKEVVAPGSLLSTAVGYAHTLAAVPGAAAALTKRALNQYAQRDLLAQLELEAQLQPLAVNAPGRAEARATVVNRMGRSGQA
jgi:2-(1,2-epoxy-1,2-dihydrophenyl)acetyl-CoA isomerase